MECISYTVPVSSDHVTEIDFVLVVPSLNFEFHNYGQNVCHIPCERNEFFVILRQSVDICLTVQNLLSNAMNVQVNSLCTYSFNRLIFK